MASSKIRNARIADQSSVDGDALALPARQAGAALADQRVVAFRQAQNEFVRAGQPRCLGHPLDRHRRITELDIVPDRPVEQHVLLQHHAAMASQPGRIDHGDVDAIDQHASPSLPLPSTVKLESVR